MDDEILLPDGGEAIAAMVADALGIARRIRHEFEVGPIEVGKLRHFVERQHAVDLEHAFVGRAERALHESLQFRRHQRFDVEPDDDAAAAALECGFEQPHQIFGFFEDFHFQVADDAEGAHPFDRIAGKQLADEQAGGALDRDQPHLAAVGGLRQADEPLDPLRHADQRVHRLAVLGARKLQRDRKSEIGDERERMRRIDRERRQQRKHVREEIILEPRLLGLGDVGAVDQHDAGLGERRAQFAPLRLLVGDQQRDAPRQCGRAARRASGLPGSFPRCRRAPGRRGRPRGP